MRGGFYSYASLNCVHKYADIYNAVGLLALGEVVVERDISRIIFTDIYDGKGMLACKGLGVVEGGLL